MGGDANIYVNKLYNMAWNIYYGARRREACQSITYVVSIHNNISLVYLLVHN